MDSTFTFISHEDFEINDYSTTGATVVDSLFQQPVKYTFTKGALLGTYNVMPCSLVTNIIYSDEYNVAPLAWGRNHGSISGVSAANPSYLGKYCKVESSNSSGCLVSTYLFKIEFSPGTWGWYPVSPTNVVLECRVAGIVSTKRQAIRSSNISEGFSCKMEDNKILISYFGEPNRTVTFEIYDIRGHRLRTIGLESDGAGHVKTQWGGEDSNGRSLPSGLYLIQANDGERVVTQKVTYVR